MEAHKPTSDVDRVKDLIKVSLYLILKMNINSIIFFSFFPKGNMQRSKMVSNGLNKACTQFMKILDHKPHATDIIQRNASKCNFQCRPNPY